MNYADRRPKTEEDWQLRVYEALDLFSPGAPIDEANLFAGRGKQIDTMIETVMQRGQHAILYGERGVGKSSLANTFSTRLLGGVRSVTTVSINCDPSDDFSLIWKKVFRRLVTGDENLASKYSGEIYPDDVVLELSSFSLNTTPIITIDEFDQIKDKETRNLIANTIKSLSDTRSARATVIMVGVADSVEELIDEHQSIERCLRQIPMQRMFPSELREIINRRLPQLGMEIREDALAHIVSLARGLPHYAHLMGQRAAKKALEDRCITIDLNHVNAAIPECIEQTAQTVRSKYHKATISPRKGNIYKEVLLAAALAQVDDLGYFAPGDLRKPLRALLKRLDVPVSLFGQHLKNLCEGDHGPILEVIGSERKYRYRFLEPMMQPYVLMNGLRSESITRDQVAELAATHLEPRFSSDF